MSVPGLAHLDLYVLANRIGREGRENENTLCFLSVSQGFFS